MQQLLIGVADHVLEGSIGRHLGIDPDEEWPTLSLAAKEYSVAEMRKARRQEAETGEQQKSWTAFIDARIVLNRLTHLWDRNLDGWEKNLERSSANLKKVERELKKEIHAKLRRRLEIVEFV